MDNKKIHEVISEEVDKIWNTDKVGKSVFQIHCSAEDNATSTIRDNGGDVNFNRLSKEWFRLYEGSIGALLCTGEHGEEVESWFYSRGVRW